MAEITHKGKPLGQMSKEEVLQAFDDFRQRYPRSTRTVECPRCEGTGTVTCPDCGGSGQG